jgi:hypothetical protein
VVSPGNPIPGSCTVPANATQCSGSDTSTGPLNLLENGGCAGLAAPVASCSFECAPTYIKRGTGATAQCVKKSTVIEQ